MLGCGVLEQLPLKLSRGSEVNGFLNRWSIFTGAPGEPKPDTPPLDGERFNLINKIIAQRLLRNEGEIGFSEAAKELYRPWYNLWFGKLDSSIARVTDMAKKFAAIYAILDDSNIADVHHMEAGMLLALYNAQCTLKISNKAGREEDKIVEDEIIAHTKQLGGKEVRLREVQKRIKKYSRERLLRTALDLQEVGILKVEPGARKDQRLLTLLHTE
jgi:hypothetical protein